MVHIKPKLSGLVLASDLPLQKMHGTAWRLVSDFVTETLPTWDVTVAKTAQGHG